MSVVPEQNRRRTRPGSTGASSPLFDGPEPPRLGDGRGLYAYGEALAAAGVRPVAGADEAGRGACAGPLVAGAAVLPPTLRLPHLGDSKLVTEKRREQLYTAILAEAEAWAVAVVPAAEVDRIGVQEANYRALREAVAGLGARPALALIDGFAVPGLGVPGQAVVKGDRLVAAISAASILAKVTRDRLMAELDGSWPEYGFGAHKGYATATHQQALDLHGPCPEHRLSYANVPGRPVGDNGGGTQAPDRPAQGDLLFDLPDTQWGART
ncbi:ribonuclease HII [Actinospica durhamensis]|uniref:ribonuclease HII n=1 Tax=Actinospica durhamensis TaxID=1508375 RepID=UPI0027DDB0F4|nr:ribonuclease HII [Actinospica durhamensis]